MTELLVATALLLAFANGANDNLKGVATLCGSGVLSYRKALALATASTLAGALLALVLAGGLVEVFSARGLLPAALLDQDFLTSVAGAATGTVLLATWLGLPISTTHALLGGLAGAGLVTAGGELQGAALASRFALPLLLGPLLAVGLAAALHALLGRRLETWHRATGQGAPEPAPPWVPSRRTGGLLLVPGLDGVLALAHVTSAGFVGFARGLNDAPKIVGVLVGAGALAPWNAALAVAAAMALGGLVGASRVTRTLAHEITPLAPSQGLLANLSTSLLVLAASHLSLPVSTTHVATGGIAGMGGVTGGLRWRTALRIGAAWLTTLPLAAALGAALAWGLG